MNWIEYFKNLAENVKLKSKDDRTKIGAVIVGKDNQVLSVGYNSFPRGAKDDLSERQERPEKYFWFEHAERNAIYNAARSGICIDGATMYLSCPMPCMDCARGIINSGIKTVYCKDIENTSKTWDDHSIRSIQLFKECGVNVVYYDKDLFGNSNPYSYID